MSEKLDSLDRKMIQARKKEGMNARQYYVSQNAERTLLCHVLKYMNETKQLDAFLSKFDSPMKKFALGLLESIDPKILLLSEKITSTILKEYGGINHVK